MKRDDDPKLVNPKTPPNTGLQPTPASGIGSRRG
jgi:hypothetical protein